MRHWLRRRPQPRTGRRDRTERFDVGTRVDNIFVQGAGKYREFYVIRTKRPDNIHPSGGHIIEAAWAYAEQNYRATII